MLVRCVISLVLGSLLPVSHASAGPKSLLLGKKASKGKTEIAKDGFEAGTHDGDAKDALTWNMAGGSLLSAGNTRSMAVTTATDFRLRRQTHQLSFAMAGNFARSASSADAAMETTVSNLQSRMRYDYFFSHSMAAFLAVSARRDRFQGLDLRMNVAPGVAYYVVDETEELAWVELGYDYQYDLRRQDFIDEALVDGNVVNNSEIRHNTRVFLGYDNQLNEHVSFSAALEYLQSIEDSENWRMNWDAAMTSSIAGRLSSAVTVSVRYDKNPLPGVVPTDVLPALNLVDTLL